MVSRCMFTGLCRIAQTMLRLAEEERHGGAVLLALWEGYRGRRAAKQVQCLERQTGWRVR
jgi:hypothetical protein